MLPLPLQNIGKNSLKSRILFAKMALKMKCHYHIIAFDSISLLNMRKYPFEMFICTKSALSRQNG